MSGSPQGLLQAENIIPDLEGQFYLEILRDVHDKLCPERYLEIGVHTGQSLFLSTARTIGIDPNFHFQGGSLEQWVAKIGELHLYRQTSDEFFSAHDPSKILGGPLGFAFLDGLHHCEVLLRDFANVERFCDEQSVVALHDCLPVEPGIAARVFDPDIIKVEAHKTWWAGDVWKTALILKRFRPDLAMVALDAAPTGLILIANLDASNRLISSEYDRFVDEMERMDLTKIGTSHLFDELEVKSTSSWLEELEFLRKAKRNTSTPPTRAGTFLSRFLPKF